MKTVVGKIIIKDTSPNTERKSKTIPIRTKNGNLKRRFLHDLISRKLVIPSDGITTILGEVLEELSWDKLYIEYLLQDKHTLEKDLEEIVEKYEGEIEGLQAELAEKDDDIADLQTDVCETHATAAEILTVIEDGRDAEGE